jgi:hypothetical protein
VAVRVDQATAEGLRRRAQELDARELRLDAWERAADERDRIADERDRVADERERLADDRERFADERNLRAEARELQLAELQLCTDRLARNLGMLTQTLEQRAIEAVERARTRLVESAGRLDHSEALVHRRQSRDRRGQAAVNREVAASERLARKEGLES